MSEPLRTHAIQRTNPKGEDFIGTCTLCGTPGLSMADALKPCPNPGGVPGDLALLDLLSSQEEKGG